MKHIRLFVLLVLAVGFCGFLGSVVGGLIGGRALFICGFAGGIVGSWVAAWACVHLGWIPPERMRATALGTLIGFLAAATVAVNTLQSPVGPVLSTLLIGIGGVVGSRVGRPKPDPR